MTVERQVAAPSLEQAETTDGFGGVREVPI
jgi:hypothetical protein